MDGQRVTVTYSDPSNLWPQLAAPISSLLPLRNLTFRSQQGQTRHISVLEVDLKRFGSEGDEEASKRGIVRLGRGYLNILFVTCEDNEIYKSTTRAQIRSFLDAVQNRKLQEWLVVYVTNLDGTEATSGRKAGGGYLPGFRGTVFDKMKSEFNIGKKDRFTSIPRPNPRDPAANEPAELASWSDFITKFRESIISGFILHVQQGEDDVRRFDSQRHMPGWNYCTFFALKEELAMAYEIMGLYEEALVVYDELEASFFQVLTDKALAWFGHFGGTEPGDDSRNILDTKQKPYRELITNNKITVFDFRSYLLARQCRLLIRLNSPIDVCVRAQFFLSAIARGVRENAANLPALFLESFIFSTCMNIVTECEHLVAFMTSETSIDEEHFLVAYNAAKADLLYMARKQLDKLGIIWGALPNVEPFNLNQDRADNAQPAAGIENGETEAEHSERSITNDKLLEASVSVEVFDKTYMALSTRAIKSYDSAQRTRSSLVIHNDIACLKSARGKDAEAVRIWETVGARYGDAGWSALQTSILGKCALAQLQLGRHARYLESCLNIVRNSVSWDDDHIVEGKSLPEWVDEVCKAAYFNDRTPIEISMSPLLKIQSTIMRDEEQSASGILEVVLRNNLPRRLEIDTLAVSLVGENPEQIWYRQGKTVLEPGRNRVKLICLDSTEGEFTLENCYIDIGHVRLTHSFAEPDQKRRTFLLHHTAGRIKIRVEQPQDVILGQQQLALVSIHSSQPFYELSLEIMPITPGLLFDGSDVFDAVLYRNNADRIHGEPYTLATGSTSIIRIASLPQNSRLEFGVPYQGPWDALRYSVVVKAQFKLEDAPTALLNTYHSKQSFSVTVPLDIHESTVFRENCAYVKCEIGASSTIGPVRLISAEMQDSIFYAVDKSLSSGVKDALLFPGQNANCVFRITKASRNTKALDGRCRLHLRYRTLMDEVVDRLVIWMTQDFEAAGMGHWSSFMGERLAQGWRKDLDMEKYGVHGYISIGVWNGAAIANWLKLFNTAEKERILEVMRKFWAAHETISASEVSAGNLQAPSRSLSMPLEIPTSKMLHTVDLIMPPDHAYVVTEPCHCELLITPSRNWVTLGHPTDAKEDATNSIIHAADDDAEFYYEIDVDYDNWLLAGKKRMRFRLKNSDEPLRLPLTLLPLKTGQLLLPSVQINSVTPTILSATVHTNAAERVLVLPKIKSGTFLVTDGEMTNNNVQVSGGIGPSIGISNA